MSLYARIAAVLVLIGAIWTVYHRGHVSGAAEVKAEWLAEKTKALQEWEDARIVAQTSIDTKAATLAKKSAKTREIVQSNLAKVDDYAPASFPPLPGSFRVWHDAAAEGEELVDSSGADAASVSLKATSLTVAENYASCNYDKYRLTVLQDVLRTIQGSSDGKEKGTAALVR